MRILVLEGGNSPEREVSLRSARAVAEAARLGGFEVTMADPKDGNRIFDNLGDTIVFPILHGAGGEDGLIQKELERRGLPFLGSGSLSSEHCFDKWKTHEILAAEGIAMAQAERVNKENYEKSGLTKKPHVLKVIHGGSSIGTVIIRDPSRINQSAVDGLFELEDDAVIEELIEGVEITIPILDQTALPALEVRPPKGEEFDYENKYNGQSQELCPPVSISEQQHQSAQRLAEQVHKLMGCRHLSRVDTIMKPDGSCVVLEINTIPGLTAQSLYPKAARAAGIDMTGLAKKFAELVKRDYDI